MTKRKVKQPVEVKSIPGNWIEITDESVFPDFKHRGAVYEETDVVLFKGGFYGALAGCIRRYLVDYHNFDAGSVVFVGLGGLCLLPTHYLELD